jgi:hypothetical protein
MGSYQQIVSFMQSEWLRKLGQGRYAVDIVRIKFDGLVLLPVIVIGAFTDFPFGLLGLSEMPL